MSSNICFDFFFSLRNHNIYILIVTRLIKGYLTHFPTQAQKFEKKIHNEKISYIFSKNIFCIFQETELSNLNLKKLLYFYQKKFVLHFEKWKFLALRLNNFRMELSERKIKKKHSEQFVIFWKMEICSPKLKNSYIFL